MKSPIDQLYDISIERRDAEIEKLKIKIKRVYDAGIWGIEHVSMANYAHRELEAKDRLREAMTK